MICTLCLLLINCCTCFAFTTMIQLRVNYLLNVPRQNICSANGGCSRQKVPQSLLELLFRVSWFRLKAATPLFTRFRRDSSRWDPSRIERWNTNVNTLTIIRHFKADILLRMHYIPDIFHVYVIIIGSKN